MNKNITISIATLKNNYLINEHIKITDPPDSKKINEEELAKVKNRLEAQTIFSETEILNKAMNLAYSELLGDANLVNEEIKKYLAVSAEQIQEQAKKILRPQNCSTLYYYSKN